MPHKTPWSVLHPGLLIFLLDQSSGMRAFFDPGAVGGHERMDEMISRMVNVQIRELITKLIVGDEVRPKVDLAVIGYGSTVESAFALQFGDDVVAIDKLAEKPLKVETRIEREVTDTGEIVEYLIDYPVWVVPKSQGQTPMCAAITRAASIAADWVITHSSSFPPVVINVTAGVPSDGDPRIAGSDLTGVSTDHGSALLYTCHLTRHYMPKATVSYPATKEQLDSFHHVLFDMSSVLPSISQRGARASQVVGVTNSSRGFVGNGDIADLVQMIHIATAPGFVDDF